MGTAGRDGHPLLVPLAAVRAVEGEIAANARDALQEVGNVAGDANGREEASGALAVDDLLAIMGGDLDAPAQRVFHTAAGLAQIDAMLQAGEQVIWFGGSAPKEGIGHARVALAREVFAAPVGAAAAPGKGRGNEIAE